jgi:hypothetical protein
VASRLPGGGRKNFFRSGHRSEEEGAATRQGASRQHVGEQELEDKGNEGIMVISREVGERNRKKYFGLKKFVSSCQFSK